MSKNHYTKLIKKSLLKKKISYTDKNEKILSKRRKTNECLSSWRKKNEFRVENRVSIIKWKEASMLKWRWLWSKKKVIDVEEEQLSRIRKIQKKKNCDKNYAEQFKWDEWHDWINDKTFERIDKEMRKNRSKWE
jgi:hypothetical protein